jgi:hypothetical protein
MYVAPNPNFGCYSTREGSSGNVKWGKRAHAEGSSRPRLIHLSPVGKLLLARNPPSGRSPLRDDPRGSERHERLGLHLGSTPHTFARHGWNGNF